MRKSLVLMVLVGIACGLSNGSFAVNIAAEMENLKEDVTTKIKTFTAATYDGVKSKVGALLSEARKDVMDFAHKVGSNAHEALESLRANKSK
jgi:hypothetical protein